MNETRNAPHFGNLRAVTVGLVLCLTACGGSGEAPTSAPPAATGARSTSAGEAPSPGGYAVTSAVEGAGSIRGRVVFEGTPPPPVPVEMTKDRAVCASGKHVEEKLLVAKDGGLQNAVVSIDPVRRGKAFPAETPRLDQRGCWFHPHVQIVPAGSEVEVLNNDGILHNIHTFPKANKPINMAQPKFRKVLKTSFEKPDVIRVACDVHSWMGAWIVVVDHPYNVVTGEDGSFSLDGVPPGTYTLKSWHESLGIVEQKVTVSPGAIVDADLTYAS